MEQNQSVSDQDKSSSVAIEDQEKVSNPDAVLAKNRELLAEKRKVQSELDSLRTNMQKVNDDKNLAEGKKDEVIESLRQRLSDIESNSKKKEDNYNWNTVSSQIKSVALQKGCLNTDKLMRLLDSDDLDKIQVYEDFTVNSDDLNTLVDKCIKDHSDIGLFKKNVSINDVVPSNKINSTNKKSLSLKDRLDGMTKDEFNNYIKNLDSSQIATT